MRSPREGRREMTPAAPQREASRRAGLTHAARVVLGLAVLAVLGVVLRRQLSTLEADEFLALLRQMGLSALLVLVPASVLTLVDTLGWGLCAVGRPLRPMFPKLLAIRIGCDAVCGSLPGGVPIGESLRTVLLRDRCGFSLTASAACCLAGKLNMALGHMAYIAIVAAGLVLTLHGTGRLEHLQGGEPAVVAGGVAAALALVLLSLVYTGPRLSLAISVIGRMRFAVVRRVATALAPHLSRVDDHVGSLAREHRTRLFWSIAAYFVGWIALASESALILVLLGARVPIGAALGIEAVVSLLRLAFFFLPSALGAAEVAYVAILTALGVPDPVTTSAAFITVKRSREALWIVIGYITLLATGYRGRASADDRASQVG